MPELVEPYLISMDEGENHFPDGASNKSWVVDFEVLIGDKISASEYSAQNILQRLYNRTFNPRFINRPNGDLGASFFFTVCSPDYAENPDLNLHTIDEIKRALVQDTLDRQYAQMYLEHKISDIGPVDVKILGVKLGAFLDTQDWDE